MKMKSGKNMDNNKPVEAKPIKNSRSKWLLYLPGLLFLVYTVILFVYFLAQPENATPTRLLGTAADPATFLTHEEIANIHEFALFRYLYAFWVPVLEWVLLIYLYLSGFAGKLQRRLQKKITRRYPAAAVTAAILYIGLQIVLLPVEFIYYRLREAYGLTEQRFGSWFMERLIDLGVGICTDLLVLLLILWLIGRFSKRWWVILWVLSIPASLFFSYVQPVLIEPLYNNFVPLQNQELKAKILDLAARTGVPAHDVVQADMSKQTTSINAYVSGIGSSTRVVLWDTSLDKLNDNEILSVTAHEFGHYVHKDVYYGTLYAIGGSLLFFIVLAGFWWLVERKVPEGADRIPILMLLLLALLFFSSPITSALSYRMEDRADRYATELLQDRAANIGLHQKLAKYNKSEMNPPALYTFFFGDHPTLSERIESDLPASGAQTSK